jgi:hypothetical protein
VRCYGEVLIAFLKIVGFLYLYHNNYIKWIHICYCYTHIIIHLYIFCLGKKFAEIKNRYNYIAPYFTHDPT